jgi:ABC-type transport system substrate-binding protein
MWDPKSPWADLRVRKAASLAIDRQALSDADTLGASKPNGNIVLKRFEYALPTEPDPYDCGFTGRVAARRRRPSPRRLI